MKIRLQEIIEYCSRNDCKDCKYDKGECVVNIGGLLPCEYINYIELCKSCPSLAKALYTNEEIELYENDSKRTD